MEYAIVATQKSVANSYGRQTGRFRVIVERGFAGREAAETRLQSREFPTPIHRGSDRLAGLGLDDFHVEMISRSPEDERMDQQADADIIS